MDIRAIFRMIDVDKSGNISRTVRKDQLYHFDHHYDYCGNNCGAGDYDYDDDDEMIIR